MLDQFFNRSLLQPELAEEVVELRDAGAEVRLVGELRRLPRQHERVLKREPAGLADELGEEALQAGNEEGQSAAVLAGWLAGVPCLRLETAARTPPDQPPRRRRSAVTMTINAVAEIIPRPITPLPAPNIRTAAHAP